MVTLQEEAVVPGGGLGCGPGPGQDAIASPAGPYFTSEIKEVQGDFAFC